MVYFQQRFEETCILNRRYFEIFFFISSELRHVTCKCFFGELKHGQFVEEFFFGRRTPFLDIVSRFIFVTHLFKGVNGMVQ